MKAYMNMDEVAAMTKPRRDELAQASDFGGQATAWMLSRTKSPVLQSEELKKSVGDVKELERGKWVVEVRVKNFIALKHAVIRQPYKRASAVDRGNQYFAQPSLGSELAETLCSPATHAYDV